MKVLYFLLGSFALLTVVAVAAAPAAKPNILIILADDLGYSDLGCYGGEIRTPNLDALATNGLRFTQFYNCARCCPARASLLTGLYPHQAGIGLMTSDRGASFPGAGDQGEAFPGYRGSLNASCVTIAQVLKPAGYRTAAVGKWHVGDSVPPTARGFDDFYGFIRGYAVDSWEPRMMIRLPEGRPQRSYAPSEFFATDAITDHALDFLSAMRQAEAPWFLYVAYQAAHFPVASRPEDMAGYAGVYAPGWDKIREQRLARQKEIGLLSEGTPLTLRSKIPKPLAAQRMGSMTDDGNNPAWDALPAERRADLTQRMSVYAGMVTGMDRNIGRLIADLRASGQLDNTLIFFLSDNGACAEWEPFGFEMAATPNPQPGTGINQGTQALPNKLYQGEELARMGGPGTLPSYGSGWANACNTPWRLYKHYDHEGGISSPLIAHWPAGVKAKGEFRPQVGHLIDLMATCVDVAGAKYPTEFDSHQILPPEGISLAPAFANQPLAREYLAWEHEGNRAIREGKWKLVSLAGAPWELYDMEIDRVELHDLAAGEPRRVQAMSAQWETWARRTHVLPRPGTPGKPAVD
ncbi:MAG: arylsulfatase [Chthoniobacter sp.]|uniref:arylsulfatase n=1 Tax=Chthoniobacter sp. TaxID=2510640 RepID=UPI0032ABE979